MRRTQVWQWGATLGACSQAANMQMAVHAELHRHPKPLVVTMDGNQSPLELYMNELQNEGPSRLLYLSYGVVVMADCSASGHIKVRSHSLPSAGSIAHAYMLTALQLTPADRYV
jgi:hypothetical protein